MMAVMWNQTTLSDSVAITAGATSDAYGDDWSGFDLDPSREEIEEFREHWRNQVPFPTLQRAPIVTIWPPKFKIDLALWQEQKFQMFAYCDRCGWRHNYAYDTCVRCGAK